MYSIDWSKVFPRSVRTGSASPNAMGGTAPVPLKATGLRSRLMIVSPTVWALGATSLLTDISSEMIASILPVYLVLHLGVSPLAFGFVDGIYQGAAALVRVGGGFLADRWRRYKEVAAFGYALSAVCRLLILAVGNAWSMIAAIIALDRIGKGIRTAPRDALISRRSPAAGLATAFGVHRAMDATGAMLGPVLAFTLLLLIPGGFNVLFVASFGIAILGLGVILLFVPTTSPDEQNTPQEHASSTISVKLQCPRCHTPGVHCASPVSVRTVIQLLGESRFRGLVFTGVLLGLATVSDSFVYLVLQQRLEIGVTAFPLLYVGTSLFTALFALPCGRLADRVGRTRVLVGGYGVLAMVYVILLFLAKGGFWLLVPSVLLLGIFYAATDGVITAMAAATLPHSHAGSGLAVLATGINLARLIASVTFGFLWSRGGIRVATICFLAALSVATVSAMLLLRKTRHAN